MQLNANECASILAAVAALKAQIAHMDAELSRLNAWKERFDERVWPVVGSMPAAIEELRKEQLAQEKLLRELTQSMERIAGAHDQAERLAVWFRWLIPGWALVAGIVLSWWVVQKLGR